MIVLGGVYNSETKPKQSNDDGKNALKQVLTKGSHRITLDDTKGEELIEVIAAKEKISLKMQVKEGATNGACGAARLDAGAAGRLVRRAESRRR
jgi:uncharacterized protein involved in type VI secretion and phage assembly